MRYLAVNNRQDVLDSRDIIEHIRDLEVWHEGDCPEDCDHEHDCSQDEDCEHVECYDESEHDELKVLKAFAEEAEQYAPDWHCGTTIYRESYVDEDFARQRAEDLGCIPSGVNLDRWPFDNINWREAAEDLKRDMTDVDFDGVTYLVDG